MGNSTLVERAVVIAKKIRGDGATTCCLHVVIDDPNFDDSTVAHCLERARVREHPICVQLARLLMEASVTQRKRINYLAWKR
jgi:hypothetical protein